MWRTRGRTVDIESLEDLDRRLAAGARSLARLAPARDRPAGPRRRAGPGGRRGRGVRRLHVRRRRVAAGPGSRGRSAARRACRSTSTGPRSTPPASSTTPRGTPTPSTPASMPGRGSRGTAMPPWRMALHDHAVDDGPGDLGARPEPGRRDGRARPDPRQRRVRRRRAARARAGTSFTSSRPAAARARWRRPTSAPSLGRDPADLLDEALRVAGAGAGVPRRHRGLGRRARWRSSTRSRTRRRRWASPPGTTATSRPTRSPRRSRSTSATPPARRSCSRSATRGSCSCPAPRGTVQEVFQDACENYYADASSVAPMVLVGREHWTETVPAWPLLRALARGRAMEPHVHLVDTARRGGRRPRGLTTPPRRAARRRRRSRGRGCRAPWSGRPWPRAGGRTRARPRGRTRSTSSRASG